MTNFYFSIDTTGLDPATSKIITIQYQELDRSTGKAVGPLVILKEWESSEADIIQFFSRTAFLDPYPFSFVPVGYRLHFAHHFLLERSKALGLPPVELLSRPFIDLAPLGILMNKGEFKGSSLSTITRGESQASHIPAWYQHQAYVQITHHIHAEAKRFIQLNEWLYEKMPLFLDAFKKENEKKSLSSGKQTP